MCSAAQGRGLVPRGVREETPGMCLARGVHRRCDMRHTVLPTIVTLSLALGLAACSKHDRGAHEGVQHETPEQAAARQKAAPVKAQAGQKTLPVTVDGKGFTPSRIEVNKGADTTLEFTRTTDSTCAKKVVFPEIKVEKDLPLNQSVAIKVPTSEARTLTFQCGMGMYKSSVVIN